LLVGTWNFAFGESTKEHVMKGVIAVLLGTMGYIMIGVALAGMG
jgi:hypothetical protein